jgi:HAMP domain-containing protein
MIRNLPIRTKLFAILIAPLIALTILASVGIGTSLARKVQAEQLADEAAVAVTLSQLVYELQQERDLSAGWVAGNGAVDKSNVVAQREAVDKALASFRRDVQGLEVHESRFHDRLAVILPELSKLNAGRRENVDDPAATAPETLEYYSGIIERLLAVNPEIAGDTNDQTLIGHVAAVSSLAQLKEVTSLERGVSLAAAAAGRFGPGELQTLERLAGAQQASRNQFNAAASPEQRASLDRALRGSPVGEGALPIDTVLVQGPQAPTQTDPAQRSRDASARVGLLRQVEEQVAADLSAGGQDAQLVANRQALLYTLILTMVLWLTVGLSFLMARSMVRPLQSLTRTANEVADVRLPGVVEHLQHAKDPRDLDVAPEPVPVTSSDELGQVSAAFNSVHSVAIKVATEQAALRRSIGDMFINLARRSQSLIDRQLELIEDLERSETDPETLEHLFRLDHLATRMRRNAEDLIVLSDIEPGRHWVEPMTVTDVARSAAAEVEQYQRVEFLPMVDVDVAGHVAVDTIHLLAELIENATAFSPPDTKVQVAGQAVPHGYVIEIEDRGLGMSDEELIRANERLADPPEIDFALSRVLGLYVVGRLAQRHGIKVQLRHSWYGGVTALTLLPHALLSWPKVPQMVPAPAEAVHAVVSGRGELPPPDRPAEPEPEPARSSDRLPIFEAARSDWFIAEPAPRTNNRQQRRATADGGTAVRPDLSPPRPDGRTEGARPVHAAPVPTGEAPPPFPPADRPPVREQPPQPAPAQPAPAGDDVPLYQAERAWLEEESAHLRQPVTPPAREPGYQPPPVPVAEAPTPPPSAGPPPPVPPESAGPPPPAPPQSPGPPRPGPAERVTQAGLPRRVPRANLAPGMVAAAESASPPAPPSPAPGGRSPEEVRSMLSSYRTGIERGRSVAGGSDPGERPPNGP